MTVRFFIPGRAAIEKTGNPSYEIAGIDLVNMTNNHSVSLGSDMLRSALGITRLLDCWRIQNNKLGSLIDGFIKGIEIE